MVKSTFIELTDGSSSLDLSSEVLHACPVAENQQNGDLGSHSAAAPAPAPAPAQLTYRQSQAKLTLAQTPWELKFCNRTGPA